MQMTVFKLLENITLPSILHVAYFSHSEEFILENTRILSC